MRGLLHCQRPHKEEAEAVEMCEDIALTAQETVLQPGAPQHALLLQDGESVSGKYQKIISEKNFT